MPIEFGQIKSPLPDNQVVGTSETSVAVSGQSHSSTGVDGWGFPGVKGTSTTSDGLSGLTGTGIGVRGQSATGIGVYGESTGADGVFGSAHATGRSGVVGTHDGGGNGVYGRASAPGFAGWFDGSVRVTGDITVHDVFVGGGDCAEDFDISDAALADPGTVMVLDQQGALQPSFRPYDRKVAGIISGAGDYKPGIVLDRRQSEKSRMPIALVGKVYCKVDAQYFAIEVGDLLTTSPTSGHAMKADDPLKAFGAVIGKALRPLAEGQGMIPVLIALQ